MANGVGRPCERHGPAAGCPGRGSGRDDGRGARPSGDRHPRGELDGACDAGLRPPVSASMELGFSVHRHRVRRRWTSRARRPSSAGCSRASGRTVCCRTFASQTTVATSRAPSSGRRTARRARRRSPRPRASCNRPYTPRPSGTSTGRRGSVTRQRDSCGSCCRDSSPGTRTSTASGRATTTASSRSGTRGSRAWTTHRSGTMRSPESRRRATPSRTTSASTWTSSTPTSGPPRPSTTATRTWSSSTGTAATTRSASATSAPSSCTTSCSTRSSSRRTATSPR